eukprot:756218-Amphidinium_carterae.1
MAMFGASSIANTDSLDSPPQRSSAPDDRAANTKKHLAFEWFVTMSARVLDLEEASAGKVQEKVQCLLANQALQLSVLLVHWNMMEGGKVEEDKRRAGA